jgi:fumarate reductase subunit C
LEKCHLQGTALKWLTVGWLCESVWQLLFALEKPFSLALCAPVLIVGSFAFIRALLSCSSIPDSEQKLSRFLLVTSTAVNAAWMTVAASLAILVGLTANNQLQAHIDPAAATLAVLIAVIGVAITLRQRVAAYSLTLLWAFWGVHKNNMDGELVDKLAFGCALAFGALSVGIIISNNMKKRPVAAEENDEDDDALLQNQ